MTKKHQRILVYDDEGEIRNQLLNQVEKSKTVKDEFDVEAVDDTEFKKAMGTLLDRAEKSRLGRQQTSDTSIFDQCGILIIDFDLLGSKAGDFLTGEHVAYLTRCYSDCGIVLAINQFHAVDFDLTLRGHLDSYADLNINDQHLANPRLWGAKYTRFAPWPWHSLPQAIIDYRQRVKEVAKHLDEPILDFLGFDDTLVSILPKDMTEFLGKSPANVTFREFATKSGSALHRRDAAKADGQIISRICAARIAKWLEQSVLPAQNILVDAPHLVARFPSLLVPKNPKMVDWNKVPLMDKGSSRSVLSNVLKNHRFPKHHWISRPVWFWPSVSEDERIKEVKNPWDEKKITFGFCEDASRFCLPRECHEFLADVPSPFSRRYIKDYRSEGIHYAPEVRLSM